jgi:hypothetical protein
VNPVPGGEAGERVGHRDLAGVAQVHEVRCGQVGVRGVRVEIQQAGFPAEPGTANGSSPSISSVGEPVIPSAVA